MRKVIESMDKIPKGWSDKEVRVYISDKGVLELSKIEWVRDYADEYCRDLRSKDMNRYEAAVEITKKMGFYGLWTGAGIATMSAAMTLHTYSKFLLVETTEDVSGIKKVEE